MPLLRKPTPPAPKPAPSLSDRLVSATSRKEAALGLVSVGISGLTAASDALAEVSREAYEEAARLSALSASASHHANDSTERAAKLADLL